MAHAILASFHLDRRDLFTFKQSGLDEPDIADNSPVA